MIWHRRVFAFGLLLLILAVAHGAPSRAFYQSRDSNYNALFVAGGGGSFSTLNPADLSGITLSNGNLTATYSSTTFAQVRSTTSQSAGKWHVEFTIGTLTGPDVNVGFQSATHLFSVYMGSDTKSTAWNGGNHSAYLNAAATNLLSVNFNYVSGDIIAAELDLTNNLAFFNNSTKSSGWSPSFNISTLSGSPYFVGVLLEHATENITVNFGATAFTVTPQAGFVAWH